MRLVAIDIRTDWDVYMATYGAKSDYQLAEEHSKAEFWSIKAYRGQPSRATWVKDPDGIIVQDDRVKFIIEVKWGALPGSSDTDLLIRQEELTKMVRLMEGPARCRVNGATGTTRDLSTDNDVRLLLVSDFRLAKTQIPGKFNQFQSLARRMKSVFQPADIESRVGDILSLREILQVYSRTTAT